ncbi:Nn.00g012390.m01.CDS01 [Neocucurbitaria sp. VM-36]
MDSHSTSQEPLAGQQSRRAPRAAPPQRPFVAPSPNMRPFSSAEIFDAEADPFFSTLPSSDSLLTGVYRGYEPFPSFAYSFPSQYPTIPLQRHEMNESLRSEVAFADLVQRSGLETNSAKDRDSLGRIQDMGIGFVPTTLVQLDNHSSRLPPINTARKAPRKAVNTRVSKEEPKTVRARPCKHPKQNRTPKVAKATQSSRRSTPHNRRTMSTSNTTPRKRRVVLDEDDEVDLPCESVEAEAACVNSSPILLVNLLPSRAQTKTQEREDDRGPHPGFEYPVPQELEGVRQALGLETWNEYLVHMENLWTGEITGEEFAARTKPLFLIFNDTIRKRMNTLMAMKVVVPVLEQRASDKQENKKEVEKISEK